MPRGIAITSLLTGCLLFARPSQAQVVTAPTGASFLYTDAQLAQVTSFVVEDFQCASLSGGICTGQAAAPFQTGVTIPKANVTTLSPADSFGNNRAISFAAAPGSGILTSLPAGVPFVTTILAIGDPTTGTTGQSPRSAASNPFFATGVLPAVPGNIKVKP
jgi:hypothetical protein